MASIKIPKSTSEAKLYSSQVKQGKLHRVYRGVYTDAPIDRVEAVVRENWMKLVAHLVPLGILSYRTALELAPAQSGFRSEAYVFVTAKYDNTIRLPGLIIKVSRGNYQDYKEPVLPNLERSKEARALLENLSPTRVRQGISKILSGEALEEYLVKILQTRGEDALNGVRDEAKEISSKLSLEKAFAKLHTLVSALFASHAEPGTELQSQFARSQARNESYDLNRIRLLESLALYLQRCSFLNRPFTYESIAWKNLSFFESYFSNYIEGTEFIIDEAEDIVFGGKTLKNRLEDSHDVLSLFHLVHDYGEITKTPGSPQELLALLKERHVALLRQRPEKRPGHWKVLPNKAGNTYFVEPSEVRGTLLQAFPIYETLRNPFERAMFLMFLVSEVHPFDDGNGRLARVMMNAELAAASQIKIIMPTVHRDNYLGALRRASRDGEFQPFCRVLDQAQAYTKSVEWFDYGLARKKLEQDSSHITPDEGLPIFNRALQTLDLSYILKRNEF